MGVSVAIDEVIDLDRYPMADHGGDTEEGKALVERCRAELRAEGLCQLDELLRPEAIGPTLEAATAVSDKAHRTDATHNAYFTDPPHDADPGDPRSTMVHSGKRSLGWNHVADTSPLRTLYEWDGLVSFLRDVLELPRLYRDADPVGACSVMFYDEGDELGWHFDNSEFSVTLMLQDCRSGGDFEYVPRIRSAGDENHSGVARVLAGDRSAVRSLRPSPGTLILFQGRHSMHCVTPVEDGPPRINAVLAFASVPDHELEPMTRELFYGRS